MSTYIYLGSDGHPVTEIYPDGMTKEQYHDWVEGLWDAETKFRRDLRRWHLG